MAPREGVSLYTKEHGMLQRIIRLTSTSIWGLALVLGLAEPALANPNNYPQYAQQKVDPSIKLTFVGVDQVKKDLDAKRPALFVDVRSAAEFAEGHLPKAVSIPLAVLAVRMAEIPKDIPVILY